MRWLIGLISLVKQELKSVVDERKIKEQSIARQTVSSMSYDLDSSLWVVAIKPVEHFMVGETVSLLDLDVWRCPGAEDGVVVLVLVDGDGVVDVVSDRLQPAVPKLFALYCSVLDRFLLFF